MNRKYLAPDNDGTSKMEKCQIVAMLLLPANQKLSEAIKPGKCHFNNPSTRFFSFFYLTFFFTTRSNMGRIFVIHDDGQSWQSCISCIGTKMLRCIVHNGRARHNNCIKGGFQKLHIMGVCSRHHDREGHAVPFDQYTALRTHFFPDRLDCVQPIRGQAVL